MNTQVFDGIVRGLEGISTRRNVFRFLGGAAALGAGLALRGSSLAGVDRSSDGNNDGTTGEIAGAQPRARCSRWIISGGPNQTDKIAVDDGLSVFNMSRGGMGIINDPDHRASLLSP